MVLCNEYTATSVKYHIIKYHLMLSKMSLQIYAMPLPGRLPNHKEDKASLLPSKSEVRRQYVQEAESKPAVSWAKFHGKIFFHTLVL